MRKTSSQSTKQQHSSEKFICMHIDKTFPDLIELLNKDNLSFTKETQCIDALKQYSKKFYKDEIKLLLSRIEKENQKSKKKDAEIQRLNRELEKNRLKNQSYPLECTLEQFKLLEQQFDEGNQSYQVARLKNHYLIQLDKVKIDYEKKLRELNRDKDGIIKSTKLQLQSKLSQKQSQITKLRDQNKQMELQLVEIKQNTNPLVISKVSNSIELESYKQQNALLRSFIQKIQIAKNKIQKLEQSKVKERKEFAEYTEESEAEKRRLYLDMENMKSVYETKIRVIEKEIYHKIKIKDEQIAKLRQCLQHQNKQRNKGLKSGEQAQHFEYQKYEKQEMESGNTIIQSKIIENEFQQIQKLEQSLQNSHTNEQKDQTHLQEIELITNKQFKYYQEIERLRIERNQLAVQNLRLQQRIVIMAEQISNQEQYHKFKEQQFNSRITELTSKDPISKTSENEMMDQYVMTSPSFIAMYNEAQQINKLKVFQLEQQLFTFKEKVTYMQRYHLQLESNFKNKQNSLNLSIEMSQNSYKDLWQRHKLTNQQYREQLRNNNVLTSNLMDLQTSIKQKELEIASIQQNLSNALKEKNKSKELCQIWKLKYEKIILNYQEIQEQVNEQAEKLQMKKHEKKIKIVNENKECPQIAESSTKKKISESNKKEGKNLNITDQQITTLFVSESYAFSKQKYTNSYGQPLDQKIEEYRSQISQINANHQNEIDQLKSYIFELFQQNEKFKENYMIAANSWREMYEGVIRCNSFLGLNREQFESQLKSAKQRKKQIQLTVMGGKNKMINYDGHGISQSIKRMEGNNTKFIEKLKKDLKIQKQQQFGESKLSKNQRISQNLQNSSEIYPFPDFSQRKIVQTYSISKTQNINQENDKQSYQQMGRNIRKELETLTELSNEDKPENIHIDIGQSFCRKEKTASFRSDISFKGNEQNMQNLSNLGENNIKITSKEQSQNQTQEINCQGNQ